MKLIRWQILWLLWSVVFILPPVLFLQEDLPIKKKMELLWVDNTIEIAKRQLDPYWTKGETSLYKDLTKRELVKRLHEKYGNDAWTKSSFENVDQEYRNGELKYNQDFPKSRSTWRIILISFQDINWLKR